MPGQEDHVGYQVKNVFQGRGKAKNSVTQLYVGKCDWCGECHVNYWQAKHIDESKDERYFLTINQH
jgi:hypothetical protein